MSYACPVCDRRWGEVKEGDEVQITRCEEHRNTLSTAEIYAKGFSVGNYNDMMKRRARIR